MVQYIYGLIANFGKCDCLFVSNRKKKMTAINTVFLPNLVFGTIKIRTIHEIKFWVFCPVIHLAGGHMLDEFVHALTAWSTFYGGSGLASMQTRSKVFKAFVTLHMVYSATVWDIGAPTATAQMDTVQTHAVRVITRVPNVEPNTHTFQFLGIMLFRENVFYLNTVKVFNFLKDNMLNYYLCSPLIEETSQRVTRGTVRWAQVVFF